MGFSVCLSTKTSKSEKENPFLGVLAARLGRKRAHVTIQIWFVPSRPGNEMVAGREARAPGTGPGTDGGDLHCGLRRTGTPPARGHRLPNTRMKE